MADIQKTLDELIVKASNENMFDKIEGLIIAGANINAKSPSGSTSLMLATAKRHRKVVEVLIKGFNGTKADLDYQNSDGSTALMIAAAYGHFEIVKVICDAGANANMKDCKGYTALMLASENAKITTVKQLVSSKADVNLTDNIGRTAYDLAYMYGFNDIAKFLSDLSPALGTKVVAPGVVSGTKVVAPRTWTVTIPSGSKVMFKSDPNATEVSVSTSVSPSAT